MPYENNALFRMLSRTSRSDDAAEQLQLAKGWLEFFSKPLLGEPLDGSIAYIEIELRAVRSRRGNQFLV